MMYQTYLPDCDCKRGNGIIIKDGKAYCRWCRTPWGEGGSISYKDSHFPKASHSIGNEEWEIVSYWDIEFITDDEKIKIITKGHYYWNIAVVKDFPIHSVLRKNDDTVLSIGTQTKWGLIKEFKIKGKWMAARFEYEDVGCEIPINDIQPLPQRTKPIQKTNILMPDYKRIEILEERIAYIEKKLNIEG